MPTTLDRPTVVGPAALVDQLAHVVDVAMELLTGRCHILMHPIDGFTAPAPCLEVIPPVDLVIPAAVQHRSGFTTLWAFVSEADIDHAIADAGAKS